MGFKRGDIFVFKGKEYKAGELFVNKNNDTDYVVCCDNVVTGEKKLFKLESIVEVE